MIAAGLCMMGGCFAQDESSGVVDSYWPAESVAVPAYTLASSLAVYGYPDIPAGVDLLDCYAYTRQKYMAGSISLFFVYQGNEVPYNNYIVNNECYLDVDSIPNYPVRINNGDDIIFQCNAAGASCPIQGLKVGPCTWDSSQKGGRIRILDARAGEKDFYVAYGQWGWKWYLLPMRTVKNDKAVFEFETKTLVEL